VNAEWLPENNEASDASPSDLTPVTIPVYKADAYVQASVELHDDATAFDNEVLRLMTDAKDRLEATAFWTGSGSGQPTGLITRLETVTTSRVAGVSNVAISSADIYALDSALPYRWRPNRRWAANPSVFNSIRQLANGSVPQNSSFWSTMGDSTPEP
jgi:HK97 family phage major capsid protein